MMKENVKVYAFIAVTFTIFSLVSREVASYPMLEVAANNGPYAAVGIPQPNPDANIKDFQLSPAAQNAFDNRMRLYLLSWLQNVGYPMDRLKVKKRTCMINAGLSHACDYKDTLDAIHEGLYLGSDQTPGRK
ncbi:unnamed protein product [Orchesella dallaii]|uniref:Uncharacterized protein n=1 Tax=Orchesella dallaii TaxID=48710 RepID=A0ABP1QYI8_9HEXA